MRIIYTHEGKKFLLRDTSRDYHCQFGFFKKDDLTAKNGTIIESNTGKKATIFDATFKDRYEKIKRGAQIIPQKDVGVIIAKTGIGKDSVIVDAGAGSGALCLMLAHIAKKVTTYDVREDHVAIVQKNIDDFGFKNIQVKHKDIKEGIDETDVDVVTLDMPDPWNALEAVKSALKRGGFLVTYSPTVPQIMDVVEGLEADEAWDYIETIEILERQWDVSKRKVRPKSQQIGHSGFLTFARRI